MSGYPRAINCTDHFSSETAILINHVSCPLRYVLIHKLSPTVWLCSQVLQKPFQSGLQVILLTINPE